MAEELSAERIAHLKSYKISPEVQAARDAKARALIASENPDEQPEIVDIGLGKGRERSLPKSDLRLRGSSDPDAPTLSANDFNGNTTVSHETSDSAQGDVVVGFRSARGGSKVEQNEVQVNVGGEDMPVGYRPAHPKSAVKTVQADTEQDPTWGDRAQDAGISLAKGVISFPEAIVGLGDMVTGGRVGKAAEDLGIKFEESKQILDSWKSDAGKTEAQAVEAADGFVATGKAALDNPFVIADTVIESLPSIAGGGLFGRALVKAMPRFVGAVGAGAAGEGVIAAGGSAESMRQQTEDGLLTPTQSALAAATGVSIGVISKFGGSVAAKLGIKDVDNVLINGSPADVELIVKKSLARKLVEGGFSEGVLEEMPQSAIETMLSNVALDKPIMEGVPEAAAMGGIAGAAMGAGAQFAPAQKSRGQRIIEKLKEIKGTPDTPATQEATVSTTETDELVSAASETIPAADILEDDDLGANTVSAKPNTVSADVSIGSQGDETLKSTVDLTANDAATSDLNDTPKPTDAQKEAGNYKVGRATISGMDISIENPSGSKRNGVDKDGTAWENTQNGHYGYVKGVVARAPDKEHVDVNIKSGTEDNFAGDVYVINQIDPTTGLFDEPKAYIGYSSQEEAEAAYRSNYADNWKGLDSTAQVPMDKFKAMLNDEKAFLKPIKASKQNPNGISQESKQIPITKKTTKPVTINPLFEKNRATIESLAPRMNWATIGNKRIDDAQGNQIGRSKYEPIDEAMDDIRKQSGVSYQAMREAVRKAVHGEKLSKAEQYTINLISIYAEANPSIVSPIDNEQAARLQAEYNAEPAGTFDELVYGLDTPTAKIAVTELSDDALLEGATNLMSYEEVEALFNSVGVPNEQETDSERVDTQAENDDTRGTVAGQTENVNPESQPENVKPQENNKTRPVVEAITTRRAAATQIGKKKQFDTYLALAKKLMNGEAVKPANFKLAATTFKADAKLAESFTQLFEIAQAPAKVARAEKTSAIDGYKQRIAAAKTADALQTIAGEIQHDSALSDSQAATLDDLVFDAQDALEVLSQPETEKSPEATPVKADIKSVEKSDLFGDNTQTKQAIADAERAKDAKRNTGNADTEGFTLTGSKSEADKATAAGAQDLFAAAKESGRLEVISVTDKKQFADNKVFTADKVEAARARLKSKLGTLNSGIDPELLIDGMTIAGAYIESGVRSFSAYAKAMTSDFGDSIKPYLLSFYEAARAYPDIEKTGMSDFETAAKEHQALITPAIKKLVKEVIGNGIVESKKVKAKPEGQQTLTQDWGVDHIDGWTDNKYGTGTNERENGVTNGVKDQFLAETKKYLNQVAKLLEAEGFTPHVDRRGRLQKAVSVNEAGVAVSGEVSLTMLKGDVGVYIDIGASSVSFLSGSHPQGVSIMARVTGKAKTDQYAGDGQNNWLRSDLNATSLAEKMINLANNVRVSQDYVKNESAENAKGDQNARTDQARQVPDGTAQSDLLTEQPRDSDSQSLDDGLASAGGKTDQQERVRASVSKTDGSGTGSSGEPDGDGSPSAAREDANAGNQPRAATDGLKDFEITEEVELGKGSAAQKYQDNINAIKLIKTLESENRKATPDERKKLARYVGFGALSAVFTKGNANYNELKALLTDEEYGSARASILNAYYTSPTLVNSMYAAVDRIGFKGGRVLEPSLGSGNFFGLMPTGLRNKSQLNGVELDSITSRLAKHLYPNANVATSTGFETYQAPNGYFDLVVSNPPFGSEKLRDNDKTPYSGFSIHNYFIAKSIDKLREGGVMAVVVSHNFMDAQNSQARAWIAERAKLLGAVRLPSDAFKENAGTEVITDILYFQKSSISIASQPWVNVSDIELTNAKTQETYKVSVNKYFLNNPDDVLGTVEPVTTQFGNGFTVKSNGNIEKQLKTFNETLPEAVYEESTESIELLDSSDNVVPDGVKVGTFYKDENGDIRQRTPDVLGLKRSTAFELPNEKAKERMLGMMALRDLLRDQMRLERDPMATTKEIERNRERLNARYDEYLKKQGYLNSATNRRLFLDDTESALLQALEFNYDQGVSKAKSAATGQEERPASATKADIFRQRVLFPPSDSITVNSAKDALLASLNVKGRADVDYMAEVYDKPKDEIVAELGDVIFNDPNKGYVTADEYLSGDVKTKLVEAKSYAKTNPDLKRNVEALEKVIPKNKLPSEIYASAGANWIPADVYAEFVAEITGIPKANLEYRYVSAAAIWVSEKSNNGDIGKMTSDFGTEKINAYELFGLLINGKAPDIKKSVMMGGDRRLVTDVEGTELARTKYEKIKETWNSWIFKDGDRADKLASIYNEKHNRIVSRKYDGSHMQFYGVSPLINLRQHQKDVVWRGVQSRNVLLDHVVGAGKTMAMASMAMEMKRLGIARKPLFVVPNHLTLQWRSEFTTLYPASNILAATPDDFAKDKREKMFSKMVTGGYDAIIIGHSSLTKVGLPAEIEEKMYAEQVEEISAAIEVAKSDRGDRGITRDMEKIKANLEAKIARLKEKAGVKDNVVTFDELGIDALFVDEMHEFKNLFFTTQMQRTAGLGNPSGSGKALDMFMKIKWMQDTYGEDVPLITATGTPVSNSLAEMYTMQRYMKYKQMKREDLHMFDAWAKQFGEVEQVYEVAPSGVGYRQSTRFSKFKNLPALMSSYGSFADIITMQDLKEQTAANIDAATGKAKVFPVPKLKTGKPMNVIAPRSELQTDFFGVPKLATADNGDIQFELDIDTAKIEQNKDGVYVVNGAGNYETLEEAELNLVTKALQPKTFIDPKSLLGQFANLAELTRESKGKINALSLTGLANKAGLDYRIIDPSAPDFDGSKINLAVTNMVDLWKETTKDKGVQIVFCDLSIPNSARNEIGNKERRVYVRDGQGNLTHKAKGVIYAAPDMEGYPFFLVKQGTKYMIYEAVSGQEMYTYNVTDKASAKAWVDRFVESESNHDRIFALRDAKTIDQSEIDEYRDAKELDLAEDGSNEISTADLEAVAGSSQFSVYDDIKTKLLKAGVPEVEIAFIHDYGTPKKKEDLFKRANLGEVRFVFGSTPKLGAGTNIQKRLVGLHHIDAPWRPSDLEQREGRIIRQGNELYARDPDGFEVSVWRYATEQTYDTRRWQLLEHKAAGIDQLRKYTGESEIEDVASEASNSADMKAAASGNPLILEETKLRTEVKRLISLEKAHQDSIYAMARTIKANEAGINERWPNYIAELQDSIKALDKYPIPTDKAKVADIVIDDKKTNNRETAENDIALLATRVRQSFDIRDFKVIKYRGIEFAFERGIRIGELKLVSPDGVMHYYMPKDLVSPSGLITRFNNYIDSFQERIEDAKNRIAKAKVENESLKQRVGGGFESADLLKQTQANHAKVQRKLIKSTQLDSIPEEQRGEFKRLVADRKEKLKSLGYDKAIKESERDEDAAFSAGTGTGGLLIDDIKKAIKNDIYEQEIDIYPTLQDAPIYIQHQAYSEGVFGAEGFFDYVTNRVALIAANLPTIERAKQVARHELIGHYGIENMLNDVDKALFKKLLDRVLLAEKMGNKSIKEIAKYVDDTQPNLDSQDRRAKEIIAVMAERNIQNSITQRVIDAIRTFLKKIGFIKEDITDAEVAALLRDAQQYLKATGRSLAQAQPIGASFSNTSRQSRLTPQWEDIKDSKLDSVIYTLQDKHVDLRRVTQSIKKAGVEISDRWNAYMQEELYHGRTAKRTQDFIKNDLEPLIEAMRMRDVTMADFEEYLWMRHAEERNIQIAKINPEMKDGGSGVKTAEANAYLNGLSPELKTKYQALAKRIDAINRKSRQVLLDYGLESTDTIAAWEGAYKNYVPLMREDMDGGYGNGTGQGFSIKGNSSKRATGSNRAVVDIISNMAQQYEKNIIRGEKNRVATALIGLAKLNPNESFWKVDTPPTITQVNKTTNQVETRIDPNYKGRDNVVVARIPDKLGKIQERSVVFNEFDERAMRMAASFKNLDQDQIGELLGAASTITRWFSSVNTQYNPIFGVINIVRDVQGSLLNLSTTPIANKKTDVLTNTPAAWLGIYKDLRSVRKGKGAVSSPWAVLFEEFQNEGGQTGYRDMFRNAEERAEKLKNALDPAWWQKTKAGKVLTAGGLLAAPEQWILEKSQEWIFNWLTDYNSSMENAVRLSVYKVAKDNGLSKQQAASIAKNISVNFNRKGEMGRQVGALYAFFNASVQGTARISETLFINKEGKVSLSKAGAKIVAGGLLLGAMQALLLAAAGFDDDEPPEFIRDRNLIMPLANGKYITLAMPLGFNAIPAFGRIVTEWAMSGFEDTNERAVHVIDMLFDVTNPIGNAGLSLQTIAPTVFDPLAALAENKDFAGRPIAQKDFNSLKPTAGHTRAKDTASSISKALSYGLNSLTGGNEYKKGAVSPTPDQIDYLIGQITGGVGRESMKVEQTLNAMRTGEDLPSYKMPLVGRFFGDANSKSSEGAAFYKNITKINQVETELKGRRENKDDVAEFKAETPEYKLIMAGNVAETAITKLRKRRRVLLENGAPKERIKLIDELITRKMKTFNDKVKRVEAE
jgi:N12 class adenine-specific DNA methylase/predicted RNA methylase